MSDLKITREALYDMVWEKSLSQLAKEYQISDTGLKKICIRFNIPLPAQGHWSRMKLGKSFKKPTLPEMRSNETIILKKRITGEQVVSEKNFRTKQIIGEITGEFNPILSKEEFENETHPLIKSLEKDLEKRKGDSYGKFSGMWESSSSELNVRFSRSRQEVALRFLKKFLHIVNNRGHKVVVEGWSTTYLVIGEIKLEIALKERMKIIKEKKGTWDSQQYIPTGILYFQYGGWSKKEWTDEKESLDAQLPRIIAYLEEKANELNLEEMKRREWRRVRDEEEKRNQQLLDLKKGEFKNFEKLVEQANRWNQSQILSAYITHHRINSKVPDEAWIKWAMEKAAWLDPTNSHEDELLGKYPPEFLKEPNKNW